MEVYHRIRRTSTPRHAFGPRENESNVYLVTVTERDPDDRELIFEYLLEVEVSRTQ